MTFITSPLEQFSIIPLLTVGSSNLYISFTNSALFMCLTVLVGVLFITLSVSRATLVPNKWQASLELLFEFILSLVQSNIGKKGLPYFPLIFSVFTFILFCNLLGLIPYSFTVTSHIMITFSLALSLFIGITIIGFVRHKKHFFSFFFPEGAPLAIAPILVLIELISYLARPFSLSIRLFANMMSGHSLFYIIASFTMPLLLMGNYSFIIPILLIVAFTGLELAVAVLQAYVFTILVTIYLSDVIHLH